MDSDWFNKEKVTIWRRCLNEVPELEHYNLLKNNIILCPFIVDEEGCIEDQPGALHADFANEYIGGGVLCGGNVQEEIRFTVNTECIISKWLCPTPMKHNEAIIILGSQQFFNYKGYGSSFQFDGYRNIKEEMFFCDNKPNRLGSCAMIGMDALYLYAPKTQAKTDYMIREMLKCYVGYSITNKDIGHKMDIISTGNWGCGIFRGDPQLKALLQWIVATLVNRKVVYYTFSDRRVASGQLDEFIKKMIAKKITIGQLWKALSSPMFEVLYKEGHSTIAILHKTLL